MQRAALRLPWARASAAAAAVTAAWYPRAPLSTADEAPPELTENYKREFSKQLVNHGPLRLFTGNAHRGLAESISAHLDVPLGKAVVGRFRCGEVNVIINESVRDCDVFVIQPTCNSEHSSPQEHLVELLIMIDAIRRGAANRITAVVPHFGYARQSAKEQSRSPISAKLVTDMLQVAGATRVLTVELHVPQIQGFASYPIDNMYALPLLAKEIEAMMANRGLGAEDIVVVSPDVGGAKRAAALAKKLCAPLAIFSKQRRRPTQASEIDLVGEVAGKTCIVIDDMADTCKTLCDAADRLMAKGAKAVIGTVVHGVFSDPACDTINRSTIEAVFVTDTIPLDDKVARCPKLQVISVAPLLATAISNIHTGESLSSLFELMLPPSAEE